MLFLLFSFRGRINRSQYWLGAFLVTFGSFAGQVLIQVLSAGSAATAPTLAAKLAAYASASVLLLPLSIASFWASLAVQWKRFHDRGRPGWLGLIPLAVTCMLIAQVIGDIFGKLDVAQVIGNAMPYFWVLVLMSLAMFIDLGCLPSEDGSNKYGDPPGTPGSRGSKPSPATPIPGLVSAQAAMERAISERDTVPVAKTGAPAPCQSAPAFAPQPAGGAPRGFGRRATT